MGNKEIGIYVHIPFCKRKCHYCDFVSYSNKDEKIEEYMQTLKKEIELQNIKSSITTIYIGGGTPSYIDSKYIMVDTGDTKIISRVLEGEFLNYKQIIAKEFTTEIVINKNQITDALERASLLSKVGQNNLVKFEIKDNNLLLTSNSEIGNIKENINITQQGKDIYIAFNARYFMEAFRTNSEEFVKIKFNSASNPCVVVPADGEEEYLYLILPVRIL